MTAPLWRFALHIMLLAYAIQRGATATMLYLSGSPAVLIAGAVLAALAGIVASIAVLSGRFVSGSLIGLALVLGIVAVVQAAVLGPSAAVWAVVHGIFGIASALVLRYFIARAEQEPG